MPFLTNSISIDDFLQSLYVKSVSPIFSAQRLLVSRINSQQKMHRRLRRLQNLRFEPEHVVDDAQYEQAVEHEEENLHVPQEPTENEEQPDENLQDPPEIDVTDLDMLPEPGTIKIVWPNGFVREAMGRFSLTKLLNMNSGKVLVETDENGIPNQRSASLLGSFLGMVAKNSSYAPLHIPRGDSKLFNQPNQDLINYVEKKFVYPPETRDFTRDWILKVVSKRWRDYKSFLKKMFYKPNERPMDQIMKNAPPGVNEHQWVALLGIWCQDQHKETKNKGPVHKIDLWDEAHKKKDGNYANQSVLELMDKAYDKLAELRRNKNGDLSHEDYDGVFDDVIAKESTAGGYYDDKYWAAVKFCRGPSSVGHSASEVRVQNELQAMRTDLRIVTELAERMRAFIAQKYPEEDWTNTMVNNSGRVGDAAIHGIDHTEESMSNFQASGNDPKQTQVACHAKSRMQFVNASSSCEQRIQKVTKRKELPNQHAVQEAHMSQRSGTDDVQYEVDNIEQSCINEALGNNRQKAYAAPHTKAKKHRVNLSPAHEERNVKVSKATELAKQKKSEKQKTVILLSTNVRAQGLVVAKGILVSRDSTYVVGGNMLGKEFYGVTVHHVSELGHERLPRPYGNFQTVEDAIGHCIAWPCTHIKRVKASSARA
ncbi:hypothetical protein ACP70R_018739 [Stipagrostis hirtigluma subsp. patula]